MAQSNNQQSPSAAIPVYECIAPYGGQIIRNLTANGSTLVKTGAGGFYRLIIGGAGTGSTLAVYDGTSASGTLLATISTTTTGSVDIGLAFLTGLFVVAAGSAAANLTIIAL